MLSSKQSGFRIGSVSFSLFVPSMNITRQSFGELLMVSRNVVLTSWRTNRGFMSDFPTSSRMASSSSGTAKAFAAAEVPLINSVSSPISIETDADKPIVLIAHL